MIQYEVPLKTRTVEFYEPTLKLGIEQAVYLYSRWRVEEENVLSAYMYAAGMNFLRRAHFWTIQGTAGGQSEFQPDKGGSPDTQTLDQVINQTLLYQEHPLTPRLVADGMGIGVHPCVTQRGRSYLLILNPVQALYKGSSGSDFRYTFNAPSDWIAGAMALGYVDALDANPYPN